MGKLEETAEIRKDAKDFLHGHKKMIFTILDENGYPNSSLMLYAADDFVVYFGTRKSFGKYKALSANPHIALAVVQEGIDPLQVLDMQGIVEEIPDHETKATLEWFTSVNSSEYYIKDAEDFVMFKVKPICIRWLNAISGDLQICDLGVN